MPSPAQSDRNLLGGVLALQMDFVTGDQLLAAMNAWLLRKETPLLDLLRQDGRLSDEDHRILSHLVERHLARHGGDAAESLAAVRLDEASRRQLEQATASDLRGSVAKLRTVTGPTDAKPGPFPPGTPAPADSGTTRYRRGPSHARGGLGEVFVAEDAELHRQVALKEIQERFADYEEYRTRFIREAEITGQLEHPGVVPIYGLGVYGDGRPYYAMRFIRGESMQQAVARFHEADAAGGRDPGERTLALHGLLERFVAVCNAVGFAHARGIIHRDLKPENVMLGEYGETIVVDWGLARRVAGAGATLTHHPARAGEGDDGTCAGQAMGTPAYMPPEQARGDLARVGTASDIFSLGATLYCLLTGKPPYGGASPLDQAVEGTFPPPRRVNAAAPAELEAVCLQAMAPLPEGRYAGALELAADVERWLADEPVSVFREPAAVRAGRWARRHRTAVGGIAALLLAGATALAVGLIAVSREQARTAEALTRALAAEDEANANLLRAEGNLVLARRAVDECFNVARENPRFQEEGMRDVKRLLLEKALPFYRDFRSQRPEDRRLDEEEADQLYRVAYITREIGRNGEALATFRQELALRSALAARADDEQHRATLARAYNNVGVLLGDTGEQVEAIKSLRQARDLYSGLAKARPADPDYQAGLARADVNLGVSLRDQGRRDEALASFHDAIGVLDRLTAARPGVPEYQHLLATTHQNLAVLLEAAGRRDEAALAYRKAHDLFFRLAAAQPSATRYQIGLADSLLSRGDIIRGGGGQWDEALAVFLQARDIYAKLDAAHPNVTPVQNGLARAHESLGLALQIKGRTAESLAEYRKSFDLRKKLVEASPGDPLARRKLAISHSLVGNMLGAVAMKKEAVAEYREAKKILTELLATRPDDSSYRSDLAYMQERLATALRNAGQPDEAVAEYREARTIRAGLAAERPDIPGNQILVANMDSTLGVWLNELKRPEEALAPHERAETLYAKLAGTNPSYRLPWATAAYNLACTHALLSAAARKGPPSGRDAEMEAREAVRYLGRAQDRGYFAAPANRQHLAKDADLDPLRGRADFKAFLATLPKSP